MLGLTCQSCTRILYITPTSPIHSHTHTHTHTHDGNRYSSSRDLDQGPTLKEANAKIFQPGKDDARRIFVRGFPSKAGEQVVRRFFGRSVTSSTCRLLCVYVC